MSRKRIKEKPIHVISRQDPSLILYTCSRQQANSKVDKLDAVWVNDGSAVRLLQPNRSAGYSPSGITGREMELNVMPNFVPGAARAKEKIRNWNKA